MNAREDGVWETNPVSGLCSLPVETSIRSMRANITLLLGCILIEALAIVALQCLGRGAY